MSRGTFAPTIRSPLTEIVHPSIYSTQYHPNELCRAFEINLIKCLEAYGTSRGSKVCFPFREDLHECTRHSKQLKRVLTIQRERRRQNKFEEAPKRYVY